MDNPLNKDRSYCCNDCNKKYSSYKSLWNHNNKFHNYKVENNNQSQPITTNSQPITTNSQPITPNSQPITPNSQPITPNNNNEINSDIQNKYKCKYCNKEYSKQQSKWKHEQKCKEEKEKLDKIKENSDKINDKNKEKELELLLKKEQNLILKKEETILKLKLKLQNSTKVDNMTLNQLNKKLMERNKLIKNSHNNSNSNNNVNSNNNNIINNFNLVGFGKEEVVELLTNNEKRLIVNAKFNCLEKIVEIVHCGNYGQFKNIIITNMKDNYLYTYDEKKGHFILSNKSEALNTLIDNRVSDLDIIYNELLKKNKLDDKTKTIIEKFINKMNVSEDKYIDFDGKEHQSYKQYKINEIKLLLYNNQDNVTDNMALLLTTNEIPNNTSGNVIIEEVV